MPGDFRVTTDMAQRVMVVTCEPCQDAIDIHLSDEGFTRLLAIFATRHDHGAQVDEHIELRPLRLVGSTDGD